MRVLFVVHGFPPRAMGGTEIYAHDLAGALVRRHGAEVFVLAREVDLSRPDYATRRERANGIETLWINNAFREVSSFEEGYRNPSIRAIGAAFMDEVRPDLAHIHHLTCLSTELVVELARRRVPILFTLHDFWLICHRGQLLDLDYKMCRGPYPAGCERCVGAAAAAGPEMFRAARAVRMLERRLPAGAGRWLTRMSRSAAELRTRPSHDRRASEKRLRHMQWIAGLVDQFLAPSRTVHERLLEFGVDPSRMTRCDLGIGVAPFRETTHREGERLRIGFLGSLMISKGAHLLLEAFAALPPGRASLHIFGEPVGYHGDDSYRDQLAPLLATPGVHRMGAIPHERVPDALAAIDVLVAPSIWLENSPLVIREGFAAGIPVIASNMGGMAEIVKHGHNGLLFAPGSVDDLRAQLVRLLDEPGLLQRLRTGIPDVRSIEDDTDATYRIYASHVERAGTRRAAAPLAARGRRMAAIVLNYRTSEDAIRTVASIRESNRAVDDVIVVDNDSGDGSEERLRAGLPGVTVLQTGENLGYSGGNNVGIREALGRGADLLLLLNSDVVVPPDCLARLEDALLADARLGVVGPVILSKADPSRIASVGMSFSTATGRMRHTGYGEIYDSASMPPVQIVDGIMGCAVLVTRAVFEKIGLLTEEYFFSFEDLDFSLRARSAGYLSACVGDAIVYHQGAASIGANSPRRLYFATRNHLLVAARAAPVPRAAAALRVVSILGFNAAYAVFSRQYTLAAAARAFAGGAVDHFRGRYGRRGGPAD